MVLTQTGTEIPLTLKYKLNSVCNAIAYRYTDIFVCNPVRIRTKINYKVSITLYIVAVKNINTIYRVLEWHNTKYGGTLNAEAMTKVSSIIK